MFETAGCDSPIGMRCIVLHAGRIRPSRAQPYNQRIQPRVAAALSQGLEPLGGIVGNHQQATLADYIEVLRRRKWIVVIAVLLTTASAIAYSSQQAKRFQSSAQVFVNPSAQGGSVGPADVQARFLSTDAKLVHTPPVAAAAIRTAQVSGVTVPELLAQSS